MFAAVKRDRVARYTSQPNRCAPMILVMLRESWIGNTPERCLAVSSTLRGPRRIIDLNIEWMLSTPLRWPKAGRHLSGSDLDAPAR